MKHILLVLLYVALALLVLGLFLFVSVTTGAAAADGQMNVTQSQNFTDDLANQQEVRLDRHSRIVAWEFSSSRDRVYIAVDSDRPHTISIADAVGNIETAGAHDIPVATAQALPGQPTVIELPVNDFGGDYAVSVSGSGGSVLLTTGLDPEDDDPLEHFTGHSGLTWGMGMALLSALSGAGWVLYREDSGVKRA